MDSQKVYFDIEEIEVNETHLEADGGNVIVMTENSPKHQMDDDDEDYTPYKKRGKFVLCNIFNVHCLKAIVKCVKLMGIRCNWYFGVEVRVTKFKISKSASIELLVK